MLTIKMLDNWIECQTKLYQDLVKDGGETEANMRYIEGFIDALVQVRDEMEG